MARQTDTAAELQYGARRTPCLSLGGAGARQSRLTPDCALIRRGTYLRITLMLPLFSSIADMQWEISAQPAWRSAAESS